MRVMSRFLLMWRMWLVCAFLVSPLLQIESSASSTPDLEINSAPIAFPGAEGFGRFTTGGRGGRVIYVTNLNDSGPGSFRAAVTASGPRIVMFKVSGVIELQSRISISNGDLTIAGQSAPGDGITLKNYTVYVGASNVIIRFLRFRMGDEKATEDDAIWGRRQSNIIIDHCTMSWATDEASSFYDNANFTMQWCLLSESLRNSVHDKGRHGYMGIWGGQKASFHHNLIAHHDSRNPRFCGSRYTNRPDLELVDFRNNVIYNWGGNSAYAGEGGSYNMVNNYYKHGPATSSGVRYRIMQPNADNGGNSQPAGVWGSFYVNGNYVHGSSSVTTDNWVGVHPNPSSKNKSELRSNIEFAKGQITTHSASDAFDAVLAWAGASLRRDAVDDRIVHETRTGTFTFQGSNGSTNGLIDSQADVNGWPVYQADEAPVDTDGDGMPDAWEILYGLDPNNPDDGKAYTLHSMFTNVEVYLNSLVQHIVVDKNASGVANYEDIYDVIGGAPELTANGMVNQSIQAGDAIETVSFSWTRAASVVVSGLPNGLVVDVDNENHTVTISGTPTQSGVFEFTVSTTGGVSVVTQSGVIEIDGGAGFFPVNSHLLTQSVITGSPIQNIVIDWVGAADVIVGDLPVGIDVSIDNVNQEIFVSGTIAQTGSYKFGLTTVGGLTTASLEINIHVFDGNAEIVKHGSGSSSQTLNMGESIAGFHFRWVNALGVDVEGLPEGINVMMDYVNKHAIFSGAPVQAGVFQYTIRTIGGVTTASRGGTFTVNNPTSSAPLLRNADDLVMAFPNPVRDVLQLKSAANLEMARIRVISPDGRIVKEKAVFGSKTAIRMADLPSGVYFVKVLFTDGMTVSVKVLK